jgi:hypothetical protein
MPQMTRAHQMMKMFHCDVTLKRVVYGNGAARKQTQAQTTVATVMTIANNRERRNRAALRKGVLSVEGVAVVAIIL